jgi:hypothetical protein
MLIAEVIYGPELISESCVVKAPVPRSLAWVCGRWFVVIAGLYPARGVSVCLLWVLCFVRQRYVRQVIQSSRAVFPNLCETAAR